MYKFCIKRFIDIVFSLLAIVFLSPLLITVMICLYFSNNRSGVFFMPLRPGRNGKLFRLIKFKSMRDAYDAKGDRLPDEKRLTTIGRIIRLASIDELPQLFNVLKGDMSFVGPRPLSATYLPYYNDEERKRHDVLPGITGWAQVNGRKNVTWDQKFAYDLYYVNHVSFSLDLKVLFQTIVNVIKHKDVGVDESGKIHFSKFREQQWSSEGRENLIEEARQQSKYYWNLINS